MPASLLIVDTLLWLRRLVSTDSTRLSFIATNMVSQIADIYYYDFVSGKSSNLVGS